MLRTSEKRDKAQRVGTSVAPKAQRGSFPLSVETRVSPTSTPQTLNLFLFYLQISVKIICLSCYLSTQKKKYYQHVITHENIQWPEIIILRLLHLRDQNLSKAHNTSRSSSDSLIGKNKKVLKSDFANLDASGALGLAWKMFSFPHRCFLFFHLFSYPGLTHFNFNLLNRFSPWIHLSGS